MKFTKAHKQKLSQARKDFLSSGGNPPMLGKKHSNETKIKLSISRTGVIMSNETKEKIRIASVNNGNRPPDCTGRICSKETREKIRQSRLGSKSNLWKGGTSKLTELLISCSNYKIWRQSVFERDDYTCQECREIGGTLNADHIVSFSFLFQEMFKELNNYEKSVEEKYKSALDFSPLWDINNGRTLCVDCHRLTDTYGRHGVSFNRRK